MITTKNQISNLKKHEVHQTPSGICPSIFIPFWRNQLFFPNRSQPTNDRKSEIIF